MKQIKETRVPRKGRILLKFRTGAAHGKRTVAFVIGEQEKTQQTLKGIKTRETKKNKPKTMNKLLEKECVKKRKGKVRTTVKSCRQPSG